MKNLENALLAWLYNAEAVGASACTLDNYRRSAEKFRRFVAENGLEDAAGSYQTIQRYRDHLVASGLAPGSVKQHLTILKAFFRYASAEEMGADRFFDRDPVGKSLFPLASRSRLRPYDTLLTDQQVCHLWSGERPAGISADRWARNYSIIVLFLTAELRNSELRALRENDLHIGGSDGEGSFLTVERGKGDKFRLVDLPALAETALVGYLNSGYRPEGLPADAPLFGTRYGGKFKPFTRQGLSELVERHIYGLTGAKNIRSHDLRHIGARIDLNSGMGWAELQAKLGHSSPVVTQIYSGRLMARAGRQGAAEVIRQRDLAAAENARRLRFPGSRTDGLKTLAEI